MPDGDDLDARRERAREHSRAWRERNRDHVRAYKTRWREANREKIADLSRRSAQRKKDQVERAAARRAAQQKWDSANRDRVRQYQAQWRAANPEKVRAQQRASYARHRDAIAQRAKEARDRDPEKYAASLKRGKEWRERNRDKVAEYARERRKDPEKYARQLQATRDAKRLSRRLKELGLPTVTRHRSTAAERRTNDRAADTFFTSSLTRSHYQQHEDLHHRIHQILQHEQASLQAAAVRANQARSRAGLPAADLQSSVDARAVDRALNNGPAPTDLTPRDISGILRSVHAQLDREEHDRQRENLHAGIRLRVRRNTRALIRDAEMENTARARVGKSAVPVDVAAHLIAYHDVKEQLATDRLSPTDVTYAIARAREQNLHLFQEDTGPTHVGPEITGPELQH